MAARGTAATDAVHTPEHGYAVRPADPSADREIVVGLWRLLRRASQEKFDRFYLGHPNGSPQLLLLTCGDGAEAVGVAGLGVRVVSIQGRHGTAGVLADLVVLPAHRTLFPALLLQKQMRQTALQQHDLVYGLPNQHSTPIVRRLGYRPIGAVVRYSRVLRHAGYLRRRLPGWLSAALGSVADAVVPWWRAPRTGRRSRWHGGWIGEHDTRFDALWERAHSFDGLIGVRDARFLNWRFTSQPGHRYRTFIVGCEGDDAIIAYAVCEAVGSTLHVRDFLADPARQTATGWLVHLLARQASREGFVSLSLEFLGPDNLRDRLLATGMRERARRTLYASFAPRHDEHLRTLAWYLTGADEDE